MIPSHSGLEHVSYDARSVDAAWDPDQPIVKDMTYAYGERQLHSKCNDFAAAFRRKYPFSAE